MATVSVAEMCDKTQPATILFASDKEVDKWSIFLGASLALVAALGIGVLVGSALANYISEKQLQYWLAQVFVVIGL